VSAENHRSEESRPTWLVPALVATSILIIMAVGAYVVLARELLQRPFLALAVAVAWLGALVGITIGSDPGGLSGRTDKAKPYPMSAETENQNTEGVTMSEVPVQVVIAAFKEEEAADEVLRALKAAKKDHLIGIQNAAVLRRDQKNKLHVKELKDWGGGKGAVFGGALGAVVGVLAGPGALAVGAAGALIGGLAAKLRDSGFSNRRLEAIGDALQPGTSAIVAVVEHTWVAELEREMEEANAEVMTAAIAADVAQQLDAGREVAYTALSSADAFAAGRVAVGEDAAEVSSIVLTEEGAVVDDLVASGEGVVEERLVVTDEGVTYVGVAMEEEDEDAAAGTL
jgi:uncharacterized membrane protein